MSKTTKFLFLTLLFSVGCSQDTAIEKHGKHYQEHNDYESLYQVVDLLPMDADTTYVKTILGDPIDMGFDYRYLIDSTGVKGCVIGAVFHISETGKIDQKWIDEICE